MTVCSGPTSSNETLKDKHTESVSPQLGFRNEHRNGRTSKSQLWLHLSLPLCQSVQHQHTEAPEVGGHGACAIVGQSGGGCIILQAGEGGSLDGFSLPAADVGRKTTRERGIAEERARAREGDHGSTISGKLSLFSRAHVCIKIQGKHCGSLSEKKKQSRHAEVPTLQSNQLKCISSHLLVRIF